MCPEAALQSSDRASHKKAMTIEPFNLTLAKHNLKLVRRETKILQVNVGLLCNQTCRHCHLDAGPGRKENMDSETVDKVISYAQRGRFEMVDITGGAPELNPNLEKLVQGLSPFVPRIMLRSNLSALSASNGPLMDFLRSHRVVIVASFPSLNEAQSDSQRGDGIFQKSVDTLRKLNDMGYGQEGTDLELDLVSNPTGAFLPPTQP